MRKSVDIRHITTNTDPTVNDDISKGFKPRSIWVDESAGKAYICTSNVLGSASWTVINEGGAFFTDVIYVDSYLGVDVDGIVGSTSKPFKTPEYVVSNVNNVGTITGTTTVSTNTITAISDADYANLKVGQYVTGSGIVSESIIISLDGGLVDAKQITISKDATASGTPSIKWYTVYKVICTGNFSATSSWAKEGFWYDTTKAVVNFGNMTLFNYGATTLIPEFHKLGVTNGTHINSKLMTNTGNLYYLGLDYGRYYSEGTDFQLGTGASQLTFTKANIKGDFFDARFGSIGFLSGAKLDWNGNAYGLLGGLNMTNLVTQYTIKGNIETPSSVLAISCQANSYGVIDAFVLGSISMSSNGVFTGFMSGSTFTCQIGGSAYNVNVYGNIVGNFVNNTMTRLYGKVYGNITNNAHDLAIYGQATGTITASGGTIHYRASHDNFHSLTIVVGAGKFINESYIRLVNSLTWSGAGLFHNTASGSIGVGNLTNVGSSINQTQGTFINDGIVKHTNSSTEEWGVIMSKSGGTFINNGWFSHVNNLFINYPTNSSPAKDIVLGNNARSTIYPNGNAEGGTIFSCGQIRRLSITSVAATSVDINDGTTTVTISGTGATQTDIINDMILNIEASGLTYQCLGRFGTQLIFVGASEATVTFSSFTNCSDSGSYVGGGGFTPNVLGGGTELANENFYIQ